MEEHSAVISAGPLAPLPFIIQTLAKMDKEGGAYIIGGWVSITQMRRDRDV